MQKRRKRELIFDFAGSQRYVGAPNIVPREIDSRRGNVVGLRREFQTASQRLAFRVALRRLQPWVFFAAKEVADQQPLLDIEAK